MKMVVLGLVGMTLFAGTVFGLLAAQGRLNHAGTRGIPVLSGLFPAPDGAPNNGAGDGAAPSTSASTTDPSSAAAAESARGQGLGREEPLPYRQGKSLFEGAGGVAQPPSQPAGAQPEAEGGEAAAAPSAELAPGTDASEGSGDAPKTPETSQAWRAKVDSVLGQGQYQPGRLWRFPQIDTGVGIDELNQILLRARQQQLDLDRDRAAMQKQQTELEARERDVADRQEAVLERLREVEQLRAKLQAEIDEFHSTVLLIRQDETAGLQAVAKTLAAVEPKSAAAIIKKWWETDEGQTRALKIWSVMETEAANAILAELDVELIRQVLEKRLKVARTQAKTGK
jgi:hypothetical protein